MDTSFRSKTINWRWLWRAHQRQHPPPPQKQPPQSVQHQQRPWPQPLWWGVWSRVPSLSTFSWAATWRQGREGREARPPCCWKTLRGRTPCQPINLWHRWGLFIGCLTSHQHGSVSQGRICSDKFTCCHTEIEVVDQTFYLTQSQYTYTGSTSPSADPISPGTW